jgi:ribose transport system substrate-binding protein
VSQTQEPSSESRPSGGTATLEKGLAVLEAVEKAGHPVTINDVAAATGIQRLAVYRLLSTLERRGYVSRSDDKRYRALTRRRRLAVGYFGPLTGNEFRRDVTASIERAAAAAGLDLTLLDNAEDDSAAALANAERMLHDRVDVAIFFQPMEALGHMVADRLFEAGLPFITVDRPIQSGVYFGANNYQAGKLAGQVLGRFAREEWSGKFDKVVLVEGPTTKTNVQARLTGVLVGLRELLGGIGDRAVVHLEGLAHIDSSREAMAKLLARLPRGSKLLVSGFNDLSAVGAMEAVREAGREREVAIVGHNAAREGLAAIRRAGSCFIASVAFFPERYGAKLVRLAASMAAGEAVPPAVYTEHLVLHAGNVDAIYPQTAAEARQ